MDYYYLLLYFFVYGFLGWCTEVAYAAFKQHCFVNRGFLSGPICPIYGVGVSVVIAFLMPIKDQPVLLYITSVILVTVLEGLTGWAMYRIFHHKWWDYSGIPFNIGGYVCLPFSILWGIACVLIVDFIHPVIHRALELIPHTLGLILIVVLGGTLLADLSVTAAAIFKFNKHLERMERLAGELKEISDQIGENIYEATVTALERSEKTIRVRKEISQEMRLRITELRERYIALKNRRHRVAERLVLAFPKMEAGIHREQLEEFRRQLHERLKR